MILEVRKGAIEGAGEENVREPKMQSKDWEVRLRNACSRQTRGYGRDFVSPKVGSRLGIANRGGVRLVDLHPVRERKIEVWHATEACRVGLKRK